VTSAIIIGNEQIFFHKRDVEYSHMGDYAPRSLGAKAIAFLESGEGVFRSTQFGDCFFSFLYTVHPDPVLAESAKLFNRCWTFIAIPQLFSCLRDGKNAIQRAGESGGSPEVVRRKYLKIVQDLTTSVAMTGYVFATFSPLCKKISEATSSIFYVADAVNFVADLTDLFEHIEDFSKASSFAQRAKKMHVANDLLQNLNETKRFHAIRVLKAICTVVGFVLSFGLGAVVGASAGPGSMVLLAGISLLGSMTACGGVLYEEGMRYQRIKFFEDRYIQRVIASSSGIQKLV